MVGGRGVPAAGDLHVGERDDVCTGQHRDVFRFYEDFADADEIFLCDGL